MTDTPPKIPLFLHLSPSGLNLTKCTNPVTPILLPDFDVFFPIQLKFAPENVFGSGPTLVVLTFQEILQKCGKDYVILLTGRAERVDGNAFIRR